MSQTSPWLEASELDFLYLQHPLVIGCLLGKGGRNEDLKTPNTSSSASVAKNNPLRKLQV